MLSGYQLVVVRMLSHYQEKHFMTRIIEPLYRTEDMMKIFGLSKVSIYRKTALARKGIGRFPIPIGDAKHKLLWHADDVEAYCRSRSPTHVPVATSNSEHCQAAAEQALAEQHGNKVNPTKKGK